jgi:hypothetical protein
MQEQNEALLSWWVVTTDKGEHKLSEREMEILLQSDRNGNRFVVFDGFILNTAFIKEAIRKREKKDLRFNTIKGEEKYLIEETKKLPNVRATN